MNTTRKALIIRLLKYAGVLIGTPAVLFAVLLLFLTAAEYRPEPSMPVSVNAPTAPVAAIDSGKPLRIAAWNIGYGGLGAKQDFFMDGGRMVRPEAKEDVDENLAGTVSVLKNLHADIWMLQEIDEYAKRSYYINQKELIAGETGMGYAGAYNFKCLFVPYPIPVIGTVASGLASFSRYTMTAATREALPVPFSWPVRVANLKRCLLVTRFPLSSGKTLVLVNLHLEAFDSGEAKIAQTRTLIEFLKTEYGKGHFVIAGGDFNQTFPHSDTSRYICKDGSWKPGILSQDTLPPDWLYVSDESAPTCRSTRAVYTPALQDEELKKNWQYYLIDGFIVSPNVTVKSVKTVDASFRYSDHNPVVMEVMLTN